MKNAKILLILGSLLFLSLACNLPMMVAEPLKPTTSIPPFESSPPPEDNPTIPSPQGTAREATRSPSTSPTVELSPAPDQVETFAVTPTNGQLGLENEAILILEPGPGSRLTSPIHVTGEADSVFEQTLGIRVVVDDGTILAVGPVFIEAELGQRGPFAVDVPFEIEDERQAVVQIFEVSPRDGGITHLASVGVILTGTGPAELSSGESHPELIRIDLPVAGSILKGGTVHVEGFGLASFEQHLLVEVLDVDGNVAGSMPVTVQSQEMGIPGPFNVDVPYQLSSAGHGRIIVRDPSPAFEVDLHLVSIEVNLEP